MTLGYASTVAALLLAASPTRAFNANNILITFPGQAANNPSPPATERVNFGLPTRRSGYAWYPSE